MFIGYNLILNAPVVPINFILIFKELSMPFIQFASPNAGHSDDDIAIYTDDI
jgi:hypothetical protein